MESRSWNPNEIKSTSLPYTFKADRVTVHVSQGSVVDVKGVDAIVNAAWSDQGDTVGIACVISDKAGNNIKEEYRKYVIKHGSLKEGETLVTSAGKLKYKGIIHCVVPKCWSSYSEKEEYVTKLNKTILNIFHEAENHGFFKIAMPAMRADSTASTDCNIYAEVYLKSIEDFCKMRPTHQITDVHFVDMHTDILLCIRSACEKRKTLSSFQASRDSLKSSGFRLKTGQEGKSRDSSGQVPHSIFAADSIPISPRSHPIRQASMDPRVMETKLVTMGRQIRSLSVPNEASLISKTDHQVSLAHSSQAILGYPIQETSFPNQQFPSYKMNARPRGICLIISNREFVNVSHHAKGEDLRSRDGTEIDSEKLVDVFKRLHFIVEKKENLKDNEMTRALMDIACKDHDKYDCFVCCILSHGVQGKVYGSNSIPVEIGQLTSFVQPNSCPSLRDKPKIFFIQACQGPHTDQGFEMEADAAVHTTKLIPNEADFLLGYSTVSGYISYRAVGEGSLYIEKLVDMLNRYHKEMDLLGILTTVNDEVSKTDITYQEKLVDVFKRLHFIVEKKENLKDNEMTRALMDIACKDHDKYDCFVCCILSHGVQGKVYGSNSIPVEIGQLTSFVQPNSCPSLRDKPKIFFIQACQGPHTDQGFEMEADAAVHTTKLIPNEADFLLGYSTVSGYISYRAVGEGSLYIEKLVDMLNRYHKEMDLLGILTTVNDEVSKTDITYQGIHVKQMPQKVSTLRKRLCFQ